MEISSTVTFMGNASSLVQARKGSGGSGIWGEGLRVGNSSVRSSQSGSVKARRRTMTTTNILTSDVNNETMVFQPPLFGKQKANPKSVASIILGGGSGTQLFPLTKTRATPAVEGNIVADAEKDKDEGQSKIHKYKCYIVVTSDRDFKRRIHKVQEIRYIVANRALADSFLL